jgi:hypothetical protein
MVMYTMGLITVPSAVSRPFKMSCYALADGPGNAMFDAINYQVVCKSNGKPNFILSSGVTFSFVTLKGLDEAEGTETFSAVAGAI